MATKTMMGMKVPKRRKAHFHVLFKIVDLNNIPLVSGRVFVKWNHVKTNYRGQTEKEDIREHRVNWNYEGASDVSISTSRSELQDSFLEFAVVQECTIDNNKEQRIELGLVKINISQYFAACKEKGGFVSQRHLLQKSRINSTLKVSIFLKQTHGDLDFTAPALPQKQAFGGIADIVANETELQELSTSIQTYQMNEKSDIYRMLLYARWFVPSNQPTAEQCISNIADGGDGWGVEPLPSRGESAPRHQHSKHDHRRKETAHDSFRPQNSPTASPSFAFAEARFRPLFSAFHGSRPAQIERMRTGVDSPNLVSPPRSPRLQPSLFSSPATITQPRTQVEDRYAGRGLGSPSQFVERSPTVRIQSRSPRLFAPTYLSGSQFLANPYLLGSSSFSHQTASGAGAGNLVTPSVDLRDEAFETGLEQSQAANVLDGAGDAEDPNGFVTWKISMS